MSIDNRVAVLALIASDDSYRNSWEVGDPPMTYPDSNAVDGVAELDPIPEELMQSAGLEFMQLSEGEYRIAGWVVAGRVTDPDTGLGAVVFQNDAKTEAIVAFTGTNGLTPQGLQGWYTDLTQARTQWDSPNSVQVLNVLDNLAGLDGNPGTFVGTIHFSGQIARHAGLERIQPRHPHDPRVRALARAEALARGRPRALAPRLDAQHRIPARCASRREREHRPQ